MPKTIHGLTKHPLWWIWIGMRRRCTKPTYPDYRLYGARGIKVCEEWLLLESFVDSIESTIGPRPSDKHTLDRINSNGNYEPGNVRWATQAQQLRNQSRNQLITFNGETLCLTDWAQRVDLEKCTLRSRLAILNWPIEKALSTPARQWSGSRSPTLSA